MKTRMLWYPSGLALLCATIAMSGQAAPAAVQFDIGDNGPSGNHWTLGNGWGAGAGRLNAVINVSAVLPDVAFALDVGQSHSFNYGTVQLRQLYIFNNQTDNLAVTANLLFDLPSIGGVAIPGVATAFTGWVIGPDTDLSIAFDPVYVNIDDCGQFRLDLTDLCLNRVWETVCVDACVTLCSEPCPAVPEPATIIIWSLLGMGSWLGMKVWRQRTGPAGRQPWSPNNRQAIRNLVAHGIH